MSSAGRGCVVCGRQVRQRVIALERAVLALCPWCGHGRTLRVPRSVDHTGYGLSPTALADYERDYLPARRRSWSRGLDALGPPEGALLDVGANFGHFLVEAQEHGWHPFGAEAGDHVRAAAIPQVRARIVESVAAARRHGPFAAVTLWDTLEHIPEPASLLREIAGVLVQEGRVVVRVPDARALAAATGLSGQVYLALCHPTNPDHHPHHYTPTSLALVTSRCGLSVDRVLDAPPDERGSVGRSVADGAVRRIGHRLGSRLPYEFTAILTRA